MFDSITAVFCTWRAVKASTFCCRYISLSVAKPGSLSVAEFPDIYSIKVLYNVQAPKAVR